MDNDVWETCLENINAVFKERIGSSKFIGQISSTDIKFTDLKFFSILNVNYDRLEDDQDQLT